MKKLTFILTVLTLFLTAAVSVFAGSIPEDLLSDDRAQVYFGEITDITSGADGDIVTVVQKKNVKGDFEQGREYTYSRTSVFAEKPLRMNNTYLFGYFDENNPVSVWEVSCDDPAVLEIADYTGGGMEERMQEYLNSGLFDEAKRKRLLNAASDTTPAASVDTHTADTAAETDSYRKQPKTALVFLCSFAGALTAALIGAAAVAVKRRNQK